MGFTDLTNKPAVSFVAAEDARPEPVMAKVAGGEARPRRELCFEGREPVANGTPPTFTPEEFGGLVDGGYLPETDDLVDKELGELEAEDDQVTE